MKKSLKPLHFLLSTSTIIHLKLSTKPSLWPATRTRIYPPPPTRAILKTRRVLLRFLVPTAKACIHPQVQVKCQILKNHPSELPRAADLLEVILGLTPAQIWTRIMNLSSKLPSAVWTNLVRGSPSNHQPLKTERRTWAWRSHSGSWPSWGILNLIQV